MSAPVDVYFNLHRRVWSVRDRRTGRVMHHARAVLLADGADMVVRPAGRARVLVEGRKNVHAFARADSFELSDDPAHWEAPRHAFRITYNPHRAAFFTVRDTGERIDRARHVLMRAPLEGPPEVWAM